MRLFVALDLPDAARAAIEEWGRRELRDPALRRVPAENLHVTLVFLGAVAEGDVGRLEGVVEEVGASSSAAPIALGAVVPRPAGRRPRLFALEADSPASVGIQARLAARLAAAGLHEPEERPFWPHVTVARVRAEGGGRRRPAPIERHPGDPPAALGRPFEAVRLTLYRSQLQSRGARYIPLAQVELPRGGRQ